MPGWTKAIRVEGGDAVGTAVRPQRGWKGSAPGRHYCLPGASTLCQNLLGPLRCCGCDLAGSLSLSCWWRSQPMLLVLGPAAASAVSNSPPFPQRPVLAPSKPILRESLVAHSQAGLIPSWMPTACIGPQEVQAEAVLWETPSQTKIQEKPLMAKMYLQQCAQQWAGAACAQHCLPSPPPFSTCPEWPCLA